MTSHCKILIVIGLWGLIQSASATVVQNRAGLVQQMVMGETLASEVKQQLGKPERVLREGSKEYYFYRLGTGGSFDTTVTLKKGVVDTVTYLCSGSASQKLAQNKNQPATQRNISADQLGYKKTLTQVLYNQIGKGFLFDPKTNQIKVCVAWTPEN